MIAGNICLNGLVRFALTTIVAMFALAAHAQDIHFSQFEQSPFNLNPGLTGDFNGQYRFIGNQRSQWRSVTVPYLTTAFAGDSRLLTSQQIHGGVALFNDQAGDSRLRRTSLQLNVAKEFQTDGPDSWILVPGLSLGLTSMRIDYSQLRYDNQWNGYAYDPNINPGENFPRSSRAYINIHSGVIAKRVYESGRRITTGIALFNLSSPKQSFFDDGYVRLDTRFNTHASWNEPINDQWHVRPSVLLMAQGAYTELDIGGTANYILSPKSYMFRSIYGGIYYRSRDAGFIVAGMHYDEWQVGLSYDINTSDLRPASSGRGGFELSVIYIVPPRPVTGPLRKVCPDFL